MKIKKLAMRMVVALLVLSILTIESFGLAAQAESEKHNRLETINTTITQMTDHGYSFMRDSQPEKDITVKAVSPLFDYNDNLTGCYMTFEADGISAGYVMLSLIDGNDPIVEFSFDGYGPISAIEEELHKDVDEFFVEPQCLTIENDGISSASLASSDLDDKKMLYIGSGNLAVSNGNDYFFVENRELVSKEKVEEVLQSEKEVVTYGSQDEDLIGPGIISWSEAKISNSSVFKISNFGEGTDYRLMSSFSEGGVCAPTAAANILWYWGKKRGKRSVLDHWYVSGYTYDSDTQDRIFEWISKCMNTSTSSGTTRANIKSGYQKFFDSPAGPIYSWNYKEIPNGAAFSEYETALKSNCPIHLSLRYRENLFSQQGHSVFNFGYAKSTTGTPYLFVMNGWHDYGKFVKMNYFTDMVGYKIWVK